MCFHGNAVWFDFGRVCILLARAVFFSSRDGSGSYGYCVSARFSVAVRDGFQSVFLTCFRCDDLKACPLCMRFFHQIRSRVHSEVYFLFHFVLVKQLILKRAVFVLVGKFTRHFDFIMVFNLFQFLLFFLQFYFVSIGAENSALVVRGGLAYQEIGNFFRWTCLFCDPRYLYFTKKKKNKIWILLN